jgi:hypothetical protein
MPTPGGKLKAGDRVVQAEMPHVLLEVVERTGNDDNYAVWLKRVDGLTFPLGLHTRAHGKQMMLLNAHYHVIGERNGWRLA